MVPAGESDPTHVQLTHGTGWNGLQVLVEDGDGPAVHHLADRNHSGFGAVQAVPGDVNRRLGRAVQVEHRTSSHLIGDRGRRQRLAGDHEGKSGGQAVLRQRPQGGGDENGSADVMTSQIVAERSVRGAQFFGHEHQAGTVEQRHREFGNRCVETERGEQQHRLIGACPLTCALRCGQGGKAAVRDNDALRSSRGTRGVDEITRMIRGGGNAQLTDPDRPVIAGIDGGNGVRGIQQHRGVETIRIGSGGDHQVRPGVVEQVGNALGRVVGVDGHIGSTRFFDTDDGDDRPNGLAQRQRNDVLGTDAPLNQPAGELVRGGVKFRIGHNIIAAPHGIVIGVDPNRLGKQLCERTWGPSGRSGLDRGVAFLVTENIDGADPPVRVIPEGLQDPEETGDDVLGGAGVEAIRRMLQLDAELHAAGAGHLTDAEAEVELCPQRSGIQTLGLKPGQHQFRGATSALGEVIHHDLEQRVAAWHPGGSESIHDHVEGHLGVFDRTQDRFPGPADGRGDRWIPGEVMADRQRVDEEPDQRLQGRIVAPRRHGAERHVLSRSETIQQHGHGGMAHHEHRRSVFGGQTLHPGQGLSRQHPLHGAAGTPTRERVRFFSRQPGFLGQPCQGGPPPLDFLALLS